MRLIISHTSKCTKCSLCDAAHRFMTICMMFVLNMLADVFPARPHLRVVAW